MEHLKLIIYSFLIMFVLGLADQANAQTVIYRSVGPSNITAVDDDDSHADTITIATGTVAFSEDIADNVGVGDVILYDTNLDNSLTSADSIAFIKSRTDSTHYVIQTETGATPANLTINDTWAIYRAYSSLSNAEAGTENTTLSGLGISYTGGDRDLVTNNEQWNIACYGDAVDATAVIIDDWTTGAQNYIKVYTPVGTSEVGTSQRHSGVWDDEKYRLVGSSYSILRISEDNVRINGLQIEQTKTTADDLVLFVTAAGTSDIRISNNILKGSNPSTNIHKGINLASAGANSIARVWNNVIYDIGTSATSVQGFRSADGDWTVYGYSNTIHNCYIGYEVPDNGATVILKNNIAQDCTNGFYAEWAFHADCDYNISDVADDTTGGANDQSGVTVSFVNEVQNNFHLSPSDTSAKDAGTDLSSDSNLSFTTDIDNHIRPTNTLWDIGADEELSIAFTSPTSSGDEGTTPVSIEITLSETYSSNSTIDYTISGGTATGSGTDYTFIAGTATITAGNTTTTIPITITEDNIDEANETIEITLSDPTNAIIGTNAIHIYTITDNDTAGITINPTSGLTTTEAGATTTFTAVLDTEPTANVSFNITSSDATEGTVLSASVTFTDSDWSDPQTITITGVDDDIQDGNIAYTIINAVAISVDANYNNFNPTDVSITNTDNDTAGITMTESNSSTDITEAGATDTYTIVLNTEPTNDTIITITTDAQSTANPATLSFTNSDWSNLQTITITATDDSDIEEDHTSTITHTSTSVDLEYNNVSIPDITANITDNDTSSGGGLPPSFQTSPTPPTPTPDNPTGEFKATVQQTQDNNTAILKLYAGEDTAKMSISDNPDFKDASIIPYQEEIDISKISPTLFDKEGVLITNLYIKFYTRHGVPSETIIVETKEETIPDDLKEGNIIMGPDKIEIYIINEHNYKRHIFNPDIFNMYIHLKWENIKQVSKEILNLFQTSDLYKSDNDYKVYSLEEVDELKGKAIKHHLNMSSQEFENKDYNWNQVFTVNNEERDYYETGEDEN